MFAHHLTFLVLLGKFKNIDVSAFRIIIEGMGMRKTIREKTLQLVVLRDGVGRPYTLVLRVWCTMVNVST